MARVDVRAEGGGWSVISGNEKESGFERQRDAELRARQIAQSLGGGEVVIHARNGRLVEKQSVPKSSHRVRNGDTGRSPSPRFKLGRA